ncbi:hypothetical protein TRFO_23492 [Tritrichomonas foetus]|uniref:Endoplasmic reticulum-Golgi intermediate compartment protein 3 n=1 Tax=Tritrichomonas foetus TaxID=1144522 RepID=A0A1J4KFJ4_9EUKA|nr:hypothetical protein TRFO_23492 [Tritrichomonas foetus]|eukprot:OHT08125.1 hypothetical protein TRFO_23492 [Tritrichomonas foetus]
MSEKNNHPFSFHISVISYNKSYNQMMGFNSLDILPKLDKDYRIGTVVGGVLSILSLISTVCLFYLEFKDFLNPPTRQRLFVQAERPTGSDGVTISVEDQSRLNIEFDITFPCISCYLIHFDALESFTQLPIPMSDKSFNFTRLDKNGNFKADFNKKFLNTEPVEGCGSCYKANSTKCCNTCKEVYKAYRYDGFAPPELNTIKQCDSVTKLISTMDDEGCQIKASFKAIKLASEFHISPGMSWYSEGWHVHDLRPFGKSFSSLNLTHKINSMKFSDTNESMPLDNYLNVQKGSNKTWRVVYTIDVLANDFSASHYEIYDSKKFSPGIIFKYDVSPLSAIEYKERESFISLFTTFIIIAGGILCLFRMLDTIMFMRDPLNPKMEKIIQ